MPIFEVNFLAVIVAAIVDTIIGSFWYSPALFGKHWMRLSEIKMDGKPSPTIYIYPMVGALIMATVMSDFVSSMYATDAVGGLLIAFLAWFGFVLPTAGVNYLFTGKPLKLYVLDMGYHLVAFLVVGVIVALWR